MQASGIWRHSARDAALVAAACAQGAVLLTAPPAAVIALGLWWGANTVSHNFIHLPFFRSRAANAAFSAGLTLVLGIPQRLWRARHLAHHGGHAGRPAPRHAGWRWSGGLIAECALLAGLWIAIGVRNPGYLWATYVPGIAVGLVLCGLQGHYEHARGTTSHYGRLYNAVFFNDGYHVEHHARPALHWSRLPAADRRDRTPSRWPPVLRWLESVAVWRRPLDGLELAASCVPWIRQRVLAAHRAAFSRALAGLDGLSRVTIVGGGLFPRTALILAELLPDAIVTIVDADRSHLRRARPLLASAVRTRHGTFEAGSDTLDADLLVIPLAYRGDRERLYRTPPARVVIVHDWLWRPRGRTIRVSTLLLKRINVVGAAR